MMMMLFLHVDSVYIVVVYDVWWKEEEEWMRIIIV